MCLVNVFRDKNITQSSKSRRVYKVVAKSNDGDELYSPFNDFDWKAGENQSSRESTIITEDEIEYGVEEGFHVFYTREDAELHLEDFESMIPRRCLTILACQASPRDYVISGEWEGDEDYKSVYNAVYTKLRVEQREIERALKRDYTKENKTNEVVY